MVNGHRVVTSSENSDESIEAVASVRGLSLCATDQVRLAIGGVLLVVVSIGGVAHVLVHELVDVIERNAGSLFLVSWFKHRLFG